MAEEAAAPQQGAEPIRNERDAVAAVTRMLGDSGKPALATPEAEVADSDATNQEPEVQAEGGEAESSLADEGKPSGEGEDDKESSQEEAVEVPDTLEGLAELYGVDPVELASHLQVPRQQPDGTVEHVTLAEALRDYQLQSDYTNKTKEQAARDRQRADEHRQHLESLSRQRQQVDYALAALDAQLEAGVSDAELRQLMDTDPHEYLKAKDRRDHIVNAIRQAQAVKQQQQTEYQQQVAEQKAKTRATEQARLMAAMPELKEDGKMAAFERDMSGFLQGMGYSADEITGFMNGAFDHRQVRVIALALSASKAKTDAPKVLKKLKALPKVTKPGQVQSRQVRQSEGRARARDRLIAAGSKGRKASDAAAVDFVKSLFAKGT